MRSADEVTLVNTVNRANRCAYSAVGAKRIVNSRKIVNNLYRARRTVLFALHTADTAVFAILACIRALIVIRALNYHSCGVVYELNNSVGALSCAHSAADTFLGIDMSYTVVY